LGYSRQYYYKLKKTEHINSEELSKIKELVQDQRKVLSRLGTRKLHHKLKMQFAEHCIKCGRDKLFKYMAQWNLKIQPRRRYVQTTNSKHWLRRYPNLTKGMGVQYADQLWVSDITYIKTQEGTCYINMVTDAYSKKIMGYTVSDNMETQSVIGAYKMALQNKVNKEIQTIHHSDRGLQYCSKEYVELSLQNNCKISMTENGDPYENALAERMNRTIKEEFGLGVTVKNKLMAKLLMDEAVTLYNEYRPHLSLNYKTPNEVYKKSLTTIQEVRDN
jgi:putative transposase